MRLKNLIIVSICIFETSANACLPQAGLSQPKVYQIFDFAKSKLSFENGRILSLKEVVGGFLTKIMNNCKGGQLAGKLCFRRPPHSSGLQK